MNKFPDFLRKYNVPWVCTHSTQYTVHVYTELHTVHNILYICSTIIILLQRRSSMIFNKMILFILLHWYFKCSYILELKKNYFRSIIYRGYNTIKWQLKYLLDGASNRKTRHGKQVKFTIMINKTTRAF